MPRNKKTTPKQIAEAAAELPELTDKQFKFVAAVLEGKTYSDAYRASYDVENMSNPAIWVAASRLADNANVALWLRKGVEHGFGSAVATLEDHAFQLRRLREHALDTGNVGAAVLAEHHRGKVAKLYTDNIDITMTRLDDNAVIEQIRQKFGDEAADKARKRLTGE